MRVRIAAIRRAAMSELADSLQQMADDPALRAALTDKRKAEERVLELRRAHEDRIEQRRREVQLELTKLESTLPTAEAPPSVKANEAAFQERERVRVAGTLQFGRPGFGGGRFPGRPSLPGPIDPGDPAEPGLPGPGRRPFPWSPHPGPGDPQGDQPFDNWENWDNFEAWDNFENFDNWYDQQK